MKGSRRHHRHKHDSDSDDGVSSTTSSSSSDERRDARKRKKRKKRRRKHRHAENYLDDRDTNGSGQHELESSIATNNDNNNHNCHHQDCTILPDKTVNPSWTIPTTTTPAAAAADAADTTTVSSNPPPEPTPTLPKSKGPMTHSQYLTLQSQIRQVIDPHTGRMRCVRGTGEIVERIVSKREHSILNKCATLGDGSGYAMEIMRRAAVGAASASSATTNQK